MTHGGAREGAGRKPKFESDNQTEAIRVPKSLVDEVLDYVRKRDREEADKRKSQ